MAVSSINASYSIASVTRTKVQSKELVFAKAKISINGVSVQIGGSVEETARKINRIKDKTGVEARVVTNSGGVKTIQLVVKKGNNLRINDQDGALKGLVGTTDKHLIKVVKANGQSKVSVQYTNAKEYHNTQELYLKSSREHIDSRKRVNQPLPQIDGPEEDMVPLDIEPLEAVDMHPILPEEMADVPLVVRDVPRVIQLDAVEVELGQDPLSIMRDHRDHYRVQEQERVDQERMQREYQQRIEERITDHASGSLGKVIAAKNLVSTPRGVIEDVERWVGETIKEAIEGHIIRDNVLLAKGEQLKTLISQEIIGKRSFFSSAFKDILDISQKDTKEAVWIAISKLK